MSTQRAWWVFGGVSAAVIVGSAFAAVAVYGTGATGHQVATDPVASAPTPAAVVPTTTRTPTPAATTPTPPETTVIGREDSVFLATLRDGAIPYDSASSAIALAHSVCAMFGDGGSELTIATDIQKYSAWTPVQIGFVIGSSVSSYCPQYRAQLIGVGG